MKLSYLIKNCSPVWARIIQPSSFFDIDDKKISNTNPYFTPDYISRDPEITSIHANASDVKPGGLFIAIKGFRSDGHDYIGQAIANGAVAIITQKTVEKNDLALSSNPVALSSNPVVVEVKNSVVVEVKDTRKAMSSIAARFYGNPSDSLILIGITGTNGKTTTAFLIESIFKSAGYQTGVIGTVNYRYCDQIFENPVTTPESIDLQRILAQMKDAGVTHVVMEVSSHAIDLHRVRDCEFDVGVFTNLTQDHLDYHKTMSAYFTCKKKFFTKQLKRGKKAKKGVAVININEPYGKQIAESMVEIFTIAVGTNFPKDNLSSSNSHVCNSNIVHSHFFNNIWSSNLKDDILGLKANLHFGDKSTIAFKSKLTGMFNLENILCAAGAAYALGISAEIIKQGIESCNGVPGRLERVENSDAEQIKNLSKRDVFERYVFVDYAHTPDALESILKTLKMRAPARLISIFGCGGDRDKTKRPIMGEIASRYSDITIITSDNPRSEDPDTIISEILKGVSEKNRQLFLKTKIIVEPDRAKALEMAVIISQAGDTIVAAGKGHETYQITAQGKIDFDDRVILKQALNKSFSPITWTCSDIINALQLTIATPHLYCFNNLCCSDNLCCSNIFTAVSTDSRNITENDLFVALKGEHFDGHNFVFDLINKGVRGFVVAKEFCDNLTPQEQNEINQKNIHFFPVDDTLTALGMLAKFQRVRSGVKVVAITGSNGKTTTRRMTASIFEHHFTTLSTQGNLNNEIGVPLTLLKLSKEHEWAIIEMGMNHKGEIARLSKIACPDIAIITNTTDAHLEGLGSVDDVAKAKSEIIEGMNQGSTIIINRDDPRWEIIANKVKEFSNVYNTIFLGSDSEKNDVSLIDISSNQSSISFSLFINFKKQEHPKQEHTHPKQEQTHPKQEHIHTKQDYTCYEKLIINTPARFMLKNTLAASAAAYVAGIPEEAIRKGLLAFEPASGRMKIVELGGCDKCANNHWLHIIDDTYNANPGSVKAALETLKDLGKGQETIAVLGDMLELGEQSPKLHFEIGQKVAKVGVSRLYAHGDMALHIVKGAQDGTLSQTTSQTTSQTKIFHGNKEEIIESLLKYIQNKYIQRKAKEQRKEKEQENGNNNENNIWILIKGSRGMKMEIVVKAIILEAIIATDYCSLCKSSSKEILKGV